MVMQHLICTTVTFEQLRLACIYPFYFCDTDKEFTRVHTIGTMSKEFTTSALPTVSGKGRYHKMYGTLLCMVSK